MAKQTLVLNSAYLPITTVSTLRAFVLILIGKAEPVHYYAEDPIKAVDKEFLRPSVVRISKYVDINYGKLKLTKYNVLKRDAFTCQYCGSKDRGSLTIDHVVPRSRGGKDSWTNVVTACWNCNNKKGSRTPEQAGMKSVKAFRPSYLYALGINNPPEDWKPYTFTK